MLQVLFVHQMDNVFPSTFELHFEGRQGSVLFPVLFAIYVDNIAVLAMPQQGIVILHVDDILLIALWILQHEKRSISEKKN